MVRRITCVLGLLILAVAPRVHAQVQVGDDLRMNMNGLITGGYAGDYGYDLPSSHGLTLGGSADLFGSYYNSNFLNFSATPFYNQSRADSTYQSLTNASGINTNVNLFSGSRFPGFVTYNYTYNSTGTIGLAGQPNFTTIGNGQGFGIGWSALLPDWPTFSVSYSQGDGTGNIYGTNEEASSSTKTLNLRSNYQLAGWNLYANFTRLSVDSKIPSFLSGEEVNQLYDSSGNTFGFGGSHTLPWQGSVSLNFTRSSYSGDFGSSVNENTGSTNYTTDIESAIVNFHPSQKLGIFANETYASNLDGYLYQNIANGGGGFPIIQQTSSGDSVTMDGGVSYLILPNLISQAQITYFDQTYLGRNYSGSYFSGTVGYAKRFLNTFALSATAIESTNKFANNSFGFILNLNAYRRFGNWIASGNVNYAQNVQTILVTYNTSYYIYNATLHRKFARGRQISLAYGGSHSGLTNYGTDNTSNSVSATVSMRWLDLTGNYIKSSGQSILTSSGIQPIAPTPGLPPEGIIVYNGESYGASVGLNPTPRLNITGTYSHATSNTLSQAVSSYNLTNIFYGQLQYRLRQVTVLGGFTKFTQQVTAVGLPPGTQNSFFIGVTRSFNFF
ncbi:MAG TPA: hypothetical protein VMU53_15155 [Candidatus Sulfotelmatobacter sp.]|nr:hypothetical protein [Candidatus Sulfotelmatobacter sp.]